MAPRPKRRGPRRRRRAGTAGSNGSARAFLSQLTALVEANQALSDENRRLQSALTDINTAVRQAGVAGPGRRRGRAVSTGGRPAAGRRRRRVTDPQTLARRRAGLAKARAVLAAKRAAAKKKAG